MIQIKVCRDCPYVSINFMNPCECSHSQSPKGYESSINIDAIPPNWCPIRQNGGKIEKIIRNSKDEIIKKEKLKLI